MSSPLTFFSLAQCLGAAMNSYRDDVLRLLNELRYDKIRAVREAVGSAQQAYQELGSSLSPTKVPLQAEGAVASQVLVVHFSN